jgi:hypothetical protein
MKKMIIAAICAGSAFLCADTVLTGDQLGDWRKFSGAGTISEVDADGAKALQVQGQAYLSTNAKADVDPTKTYRISGQFRVAPGAEAGRFFLGLIPFDAKGSQVLPQYVMVQSGSETQLAQDVKAGDLEIVIKDGSKWRTAGAITMAFDVDETGKLADLPNRQIAPAIDKVEKQEDGTTKITLKSKMNKAYPAGTAVRQHLFGGTYMYTGGANVAVPAEWKSFSGVISGEAPSGTPGNKWWKSTGKASIVILANYGGKAGTGLQFKDIKLEEVAK